jgi:hypothetical protein
MFKDVIMMGGGKQIKSALRGDGGKKNLPVIVLLVLLFVLKVFVVQWSYNKIAPKLIGQWTTGDRHFEPLTFEEALLFTLLVTFLF